MEQRLLDPSEKTAAIWSIVFYVFKNIYAMFLLGSLFIMSKSVAKSMTIPTWIVLVLQSVLSILAVIKHWKAFLAPVEPESMENIYALMESITDIVEYIIFLNMVIPFLKALNNPPTDSLDASLAKWEEEEKQEKIAEYKNMLETLAPQPLAQPMVQCGQQPLFYPQAQLVHQMRQV